MLVLLSLVAIAQLTRSGQTLEEAAWDAGGAAAEEAATAALEEASWRLQRALTNPEDALYWHLRRELVRGCRPYLDISKDVDPKHLRERLAAPELPPLFRAMRIEHFRAVWHVPVKGQNVDQFVDLDCGVSLDLTEHRVYRRACVRRRYGVVHVSPPKPFDRMTLAIMDHGFLRELPRIRREYRRRLVSSNALSERMAWIRRARAGGDGGALTGDVTVAGDTVSLAFVPPLILARHPPSMPLRLRGVLAQRLAERRRRDRDLDDRLAKMSPDERGWEEWRTILSAPEARVQLTVPVGAPARGAPQPWTRLSPALVGTDAPPPEAVVFSTAPEVDLAEFDYESCLRHAERELEGPMEQAMEEANDLWVQHIAERPVALSVAALADLEQKLAALHARMRPAFIKLATLLEELVAHAARNSRTGLSGGALEAYLTRSSHRLKAFGLHVGTQDDLRHALADYPVFNGHLSMDGKAPLELDLPKFGGKAVISVKTSRAETAERLSVRQLGQAGPNDLCVVDAPSLELQGKVAAGVVAGERLALRAPAQIVGNLILKKLLPLKERPVDEELKGKVTYDARLYSGPVLEREKATDEPDGFALDHLVVTLCPRGAQRVVRRAPPAAEAP